MLLISTYKMFSSDGKIKTGSSAMAFCQSLSQHRIKSVLIVIGPAYS